MLACRNRACAAITSYAWSSRCRGRSDPSFSGAPFASRFCREIVARGNRKYAVMDTERHLLFGLLALRAGLIQARPLAGAWAEWSARPDRSLADLLVERGHLTRADKA